MYLFGLERKTPFKVNYIRRGVGVWYVLLWRIAFQVIDQMQRAGVPLLGRRQISRPKPSIERNRHEAHRPRPRRPQEVDQLQHGLPQGAMELPPPHHPLPPKRKSGWKPNEAGPGARGLIRNPSEKARENAKDRGSGFRDSGLGFLKNRRGLLNSRDLRNKQQTHRFAIYIYICMYINLAFESESLVQHCPSTYWKWLSGSRRGLCRWPSKSPCSCRRISATLALRCCYLETPFLGPSQLCLHFFGSTLPFVCQPFCLLKPFPFLFNPPFFFTLALFQPSAFPSYTFVKSVPEAYSHCTEPRLV